LGAAVSARNFTQRRRPRGEQRKSAVVLSEASRKSIFGSEKRAA
jgi:hypothetical protein